jgi:hypothetical protein
MKFADRFIRVNQSYIFATSETYGLLNYFAYHKINDVVYGLDSRSGLPTIQNPGLSLSLSHMTVFFVPNPKRTFK